MKLGTVCLKSETEQKKKLSTLRNSKRIQTLLYRDDKKRSESVSPSLHCLNWPIYSCLFLYGILKRLENETKIIFEWLEPQDTQKWFLFHFQAFF